MILLSSNPSAGAGAVSVFGAAGAMGSAVESRGAPLRCKVWKGESVKA